MWAGSSMDAKHPTRTTDRDTRPELQDLSSGEQLLALMDNIPVDVTVKDAHGRFLFVNKSMALERHRPEDSMLGKTADDLYPGDVADDIKHQEFEVLTTGKPVEREFRLHSQDAGTRVYSTTKFPIFDSDGAVCAVGTASADITERKAAEETLRALYDELKAYRSRVAGELELARQTQQVLLPDESLVRQVHERYGLEISSRFEPCTELGGDLWMLRALDEHRVAVALADFCGHGVNAALNTIRLHTLMNRDGLELERPAKLLRELNGELNGFLPSGQFATLFFGVIDCRRDSLTYATAASTQPLLVAADSGEPHYLDGSGLPLGPFEEAVFEDREVAFPPGSSLLLYSDALTESVLTDAGRLGEDGLQQLVRYCLANREDNKFLDCLVATFSARLAGALKDDLTAVCVTRHPR